MTYDYFGDHKNRAAAEPAFSAAALPCDLTVSKDSMPHAGSCFGFCKANLRIYQIADLRYPAYISLPKKA